jgi:hypothetical protein
MLLDPGRPTLARHVGDWQEYSDANRYVRHHQHHPNDDWQRYQPYSQEYADSKQGKAQD